MRWGIDGFQGERKKDQSSLIKYISVVKNIGCKFPANEWVFLKILRSLIRGWGGGGGGGEKCKLHPFPKANKSTNAVPDRFDSSLSRP